MWNGLFSPCSDNLTSFMSQKYIRTLQIYISLEVLASSYFLNHIKHISQNGNFRRVTILWNGLFSPCSDNLTSFMSQKYIRTLQIYISLEVLASSYFLNQLNIFHKMVILGELLFSPFNNNVSLFGSQKYA